MKKLILGAAIAMSSLALAQQFGVKGGMNVSSLSNNAGLGDQGDSKSKIGFNAGVFMNVPISSQFSIQPEILYNNLGSKMTINDFDIIDTNYNKNYTLHLDYISVPVMFQYNATPAFYLEAGPQFSFLLGARDKSKDSKALDVSNDDFNKFDFGVGLGAGYWITPQIGVNARYNAGFTDIVKDNEGDSVKNNNFQVGLAYKFGK